jgi:UDP-GlcNAc:undecaprenyl-phosphate/decaprenyl-phosphate GlcNAc-1-phosphate transferase
MDMTLLVSLSALCSLVCLLLFAAVAPSVGLLDKPAGRKQHQGDVPLVGGLSIFSGLAVAWMAVMPVTQGYWMLWVCLLMLVLVGALDDAREIPARLRLLVQVGLGGLLVGVTGVSLTHLGNILGTGPLMLGWLAPFVTIAAIIGATNAFNMVDGIDGLSGGLSLVSLAGLFLLLQVNDPAGLEAAFAGALAVAILPFLMANLSLPPFRYKVFMGDAGSMCMGFALVWLLMKGTAPEVSAFRPATALWLIAIPLMDMVVIMLRRWRAGRSVMEPDREHLHHILLRVGFTHRETLVLILIAALLLALTGIAGELFGAPEWVMFAAFLAVFVGYDWLMRRHWYLLVPLRQGRLASPWR